PFIDENLLSYENANLDNVDASTYDTNLQYLCQTHVKIIQTKPLENSFYCTLVAVDTASAKRFH
ncbi:MAG: hypothetical protein AAFQ57_17325, partial [Cyanobacteria bacterium J06626_14]